MLDRFCTDSLNRLQQCCAYRPARLRLLLPLTAVMLLSACSTSLSNLAGGGEAKDCDDALEAMNAWVKAMIVPPREGERDELQRLANVTETACAGPAADSADLTRADAALAAAYAMQRRFSLAAATVADASQQNSPESLLVLANLTGQGMGVEKDPAAARAMLEQAVRLGDAEFRIRVAQELLAGVSVERDIKRAREIYKAAIDSGSAEAMLSYATDYLGLFRPKTKPEVAERALQWVQRAANESGSGEAMAMLAGYYLSERGRNLELARQWADQAVAAGSDRGFRAKGLVAFTEFRQSVGGQPSGDMSTHPAGVEAAKWFRQGAEASDYQSAAYLGELYLLGVGVRKSRTQAELWLAKARAGGSRQGAALLRKLQTQSKADQS